MVIDRVDDSDHVVGTIRRDQVFQVHANFRVVHVFLFQAPGQLLLQQLAASRERNPGRWGSSVAAYLFAGETYEAAAQRRIREELGIDPGILNDFGKTLMFDQGCKKYIDLFVGHCDGPVHPDPSLIAAIDAMKIEDILRTIRETPDLFTPTFLHVFKYFRSHLQH